MKKGLKARYIEINGREIESNAYGYRMGVSYSKSNNSYYMMIPKELAGERVKRSKIKWLGRDLEKAIIKFNAIVDELNKSKSNQ